MKRNLLLFVSLFVMTFAVANNGGDNDRDVALAALLDRYEELEKLYFSFEVGDEPGQYDKDAVERFQKALDAVYDATEVHDINLLTLEQIQALSKELEESYDAVLKSQHEGDVDEEFITVTGALRGTFASKYALDFTGLQVKAFVCTGIEDEKLVMQQVEIIPAKTPIYVSSEVPATFRVPVYKGSDFDDVSTNLMTYNLSGNSITLYQIDGDKTNYILQKQASDKQARFYKVRTKEDGGNTVGNARSYVQLLSTDPIVEKGIAIDIIEKAKEEKLPEEVEITISAALRGTYASPYALDFTGLPIKAYVCTGTDGDANVLMKSLEKVPANTGIYVAAEKADTYKVPIYKGTEFDEIESNLFVGNTSGSKITIYQTDGGKKNYIMQKKSTDPCPRFYKVIPLEDGGNTVGDCRSYLQIPSTDEASKKSPLNIIEDGTPLGIESLTPSLSEGKGAYNVAGVRVDEAYKGVVISKGRKILKR